MNVELVAQMFKNYQSNVLFHLEGTSSGLDHKPGLSLTSCAKQPTTSSHRRSTPPRASRRASSPGQQPPLRAQIVNIRSRRRQDEGFVWEIHILLCIQTRVTADGVWWHASFIEFICTSARSPSVPLNHGRLTPECSIAIISDFLDAHDGPLNRGSEPCMYMHITCVA